MCSWILLVLLVTSEGRTEKFEAVQIGNDEEVISSLIFNGELSAGNFCCSLMCWVAV